MELKINSIPALSIVYGREVLAVTENQRLVIKIMGPGPTVEVLDTKCPKDKKWTVALDVNIEESDE